MIHDLIASTHNSWLRRLYALVGLVFLPFAILISLTIGFVSVVISVIGMTAQDVIYFFRDQVPTAWADMILILRTGEYQNA